MNAWQRLFGRRRRHDDLHDEIRAHLAMDTRQRVAAGQDTSSAERAAIKEFGNVMLTRERTQRMWRGERLFEVVRDFRHDVRYALRILRRSPGFALVVIGVLGLGIGANAAVFSLFKAVALRPLPGVHDANGLGVVVTRTTGGRTMPLTHADFEYFRDHSEVFASLAASDFLPMSLALEGGNERIWAELVSGRYFEVLGVSAALGRVLTPADDLAPGGHPVAVISDGFWQRAFNADPRVIGRTIKLNGQVLTIVGVAQPAFRGSVVSMVVDVFVPLMMQPQLAPPTILYRREAGPLMVLGRPRAGVSLAAAAAQTEVLAEQLATEFPMPEFATRGTVIPIWRSPYGAQTYLLPAVAVLGGMSALVLVVVCANLANLVFVRGLTRQAEIAMRLALGAGRLRVVRLLLVENLSLAIPGAVLGLGVSEGILSTLALNSAAAAAPTPTVLAVDMDQLVIGFAVVAAITSAVLFGLWPALRTSRLDLISVIKQGGSSPTRSRAWLRRGLVAVEVAVSLVLLVSAGLVIRSVRAMEHADVGFDHYGVVSAVIDVKADGYDDARGPAVYEQLMDALRQEPGVESVTAAAQPPLRLVPGMLRRISIEGYTTRDDEDLSFEYNVVAPEYFSTLRIPMLAGREFDRRDGPGVPLAAIVNETMARRYWSSPNDAIGKRFQTGRGWWTVVGVAADIKYFTVNEGPRPYLYVPLAQNYRSDMMLQVRSSASSSTLVDRVRRAIADHAPTLTLIQVRTLSDQVRTGIGVYEMAGIGLTVFGAMAIALSALGLFGLVSYSVKQNTREIGIRMALGASRASVVGRFLGSAFRLASAGAAAGIAIAAGTSRLMSSLLYEVGALDAIAFLGAAAIVLGIAVAASSAAAWRAARVHPLSALRHQ
jgi:macrolide transport system ATP-binding/permease protein